MKAYMFQHEMITNSNTFGRKDLSVTFEGDKPFVQGNRINLPSLPLDADLTPRQVSVMRGYVDQEAGRIRHTDTARVEDFEKRCKNNDKESLAAINNVLMDQWVSKEVRKEYLGTKKNLEEVHRLNMSHTAEALKDVPDGSVKEFSSESMPTLLNTSLEAYQNADSVDPLVGRVFTDDLKEHAAKWREHLAECETTEDVINLSKSIYKYIKEDPSGESSPEDFDPEAGKDMAEGDLPSDEGAQEKGEDQEGKGSAGKKAFGKANNKSTEENIIEKDADLDDTGGGGYGGMGSLTGSQGYRVYSTARDVVYDKRTKKGPGVRESSLEIVQSKDHQKYLAVLKNIKSAAKVMKSKLRRALIAKMQRDWDRGKEQGHLDASRLVKAYQGNPQVFKVRADREEHDTAITILVDLSGSMSGMKAAVARDVSVALSECFEGTSMKYKIVGFMNSGGVQGASHSSSSRFHRYEPTHSLVFKGYSDQLRQCHGAIAQIDDAIGGNNSDYDFVAAELAELSKRDESRKVLFVLSDGRPACRSDYSMDDHVRHIKNVIRDHSRKGVECIGIGIQSDAVEEIYPKNVVVDDVDELAGKVFSILTGLLVK